MGKDGEGDLGPVGTPGGPRARKRGTSTGMQGLGVPGRLLSAEEGGSAGRGGTQRPGAQGCGRDSSLSPHSPPSLSLPQAQGMVWQGWTSGRRDVA